MNQTGDAAEQIVNMATSVGMKGVEVATNLAGKGALSLATFLIAALKDQKRTKGKTRMQAFNGKSTKVFVIKTSELKRFAEEARKYGVLYAAVANRTRSRTCANAAVANRTRSRTCANAAIPPRGMPGDLWRYQCLIGI